MSKRASDILKLVVFLGIGIFFIYWFLLKMEPDQKRAVWEAFINANYWWVALAMIVSLISHWLRALRWNLLYNAINISPNTNNTFGSVMVAYLANLAFPRLGEVARCATMRTSENIPIEKSLGTVVTERVIDVLLFVVIVVCSLLLMYGEIKDWLYNSLIDKYESLPSVSVLLAIVVGLVVMTWGGYKLFWHKLLRFPIFQKIDQFVHGCIEGFVSIFHLGRMSTIRFIIYSLLIYFLYIAGGLIIMQAFPESKGLGLAAAFTLYLFGSIGMTFSQGGLGVYPVLVQMALSIYGVSVETGTAAGWLLWAAQQAVVIVVGIGYLVYFSQTKKKNNTRQTTL